MGRVLGFEFLVLGGSMYQTLRAGVPALLSQTADGQTANARPSGQEFPRSFLRQQMVRQQMVRQQMVRQQMPDFAGRSARAPLLNDCKPIRDRSGDEWTALGDWSGGILARMLRVGRV